LAFATLYGVGEETTELQEERGKKESFESFLQRSCFWKQVKLRFESTLSREINVCAATYVFCKIELNNLLID